MMQISGACAFLIHFPEHHHLAMLQNRILGKMDLWSHPVSLLCSGCYYNCIEV